MKKTTKLVLMSVVTIALCISLIAGATFALFTDNDSVNITVSSGKVDVVAEIDTESLVTYSYDANAESEEDKVLDHLWGGTAKFDVDGNLEITNMVPYDGVEFDINITNYSTVVTKWQLQMTCDGDILDTLDVTISGLEGLTMTDVGSTKVSNWETLSAATSSDGELVATITVKLEMPEKATDQDQSGIISVAVYAVQGNAETVDPIVYPAGVTADSFTDNYIAVTADGTYIENTNKGIKDAITAGGKLYFKEGATLANFDTHVNVVKDLTIYANGADFGRRDISIGQYVAPNNVETTINIYNARNLGVWASPQEGRKDVWNVNLYDCVNDGCLMLMYRGSNTTTSIINFTAVNCTASGYTDSIIHTTVDGTIKITNCTFNNNCAPVNIAHKQAGDMSIVVENCTFNGCGKINPEDDYFAPARFVNNSSTGSMDVTLKNNTFSGTIGTNGDILLGDHRDGKVNHAMTVEITTKMTVMVRMSPDTLVECAANKTTTLNPFND